jgi:uncharacterized protein (TIGR02217 family)
VTAPPNFPSLAGQSWSVHKRPTFSTRVAGHVSGREVRQSLYADTLYEFELTFDGLSSASDAPGLGANSLQTLMGFYLQAQGQFGTFLYTDPTDNAVTGQGIATGDGATTSFAFLRTLGGFAEPVGWVTAVENIYFNGAVQSASAYSITAPNGLNNVLTFTSPPGAGVAVTADFTYAFVCRFLDDQNDFEEFMNGLWQVQSLKFRSVKP